jgi:DNA-binding LacI/PurR family transcriptional regulator
MDFCTDSMTPTKHAKIRNEIRQDILSGKYKPGDRLPTEAELVLQFATSRPTVSRALRDLQHEGLIARRAGSGTYVNELSGHAQGHLFGLVIPRLGETEIFDPICRELARSTEQNHHALIWAATSATASGDIEEQAWQSCQQCIGRKVAGVFFAPLEWTPNAETINQRIARAFDAAGIPIVLLDRDLFRYPRRSRYDRVGIDNRAAGCTVTDHLLRQGCTKIGFLSRPYSAETVTLRLAGYGEALAKFGIAPSKSWVTEGDPADVEFVRQYLKHSAIDGLVCANDFTASKLMQTLEVLGINVPRQIRVVAIDDVKYASLLRVPLTTLHQPCEHIGAAAVRALIERVAHPDLPARDILFQCSLVVRESCGARLNHVSNPAAALLSTGKPALN